ncbi:MAG TPA: hypothetical protein VLA50_11990, partial [Erythrobacter sp.]|nr:hypothetical protein [Erythrobacter sp.]
MRWSASIERGLDDGSQAGDDIPAIDGDAIDQAIGIEAGCTQLSQNGAALDGRGGAPVLSDMTRSDAHETGGSAFRLKIALGPIDRASLLAAMIGGIGYLALASLSLQIGRVGETVSPIWLPNACAVVFLLRARLSNELPFLMAAFAASLCSNIVSQLPDHVALLFTIANVAEIIAVVALTRP